METEENEANSNNTRTRGQKRKATKDAVTNLKVKTEESQPEIS